MSESVACIRCVFWKSLTMESGWCVRSNHVSGRCENGIRELYPVTFALDGCLLGEVRDGKRDTAAS